MDMKPDTPVRLTAEGRASLIRGSACLESPRFFPEVGVFIKYTHDPGSGTYRRLVVVETVGPPGVTLVRGTYMESSWESMPTA